MSSSNDVNGYEQFLVHHEAQLRASDVPDHLFKAISHKLNHQIFDAGEFFQLLLIDYGDEDRGEKEPAFAVATLKDIKAEDPNAVFLIDHALTFKADILRKQLVENPSIISRLSLMIGLPTSDDVEKVMENIWRFSNFYSINAHGEISSPIYHEYLLTLLNFRCHCRIFTASLVCHGRSGIGNSTQRRSQL